MGAVVSLERSSCRQNPKKWHNTISQILNVSAVECTHENRSTTLYRLRRIFVLLRDNEQRN